MKIVPFCIFVFLVSAGSVFSQDTPATGGTTTLSPTGDKATTKAAAPTKGAADEGEPTGFWPSLFKNNPGVVTTLLTAFLLPIVILVLTNWKASKDKDKDHIQAIDMEKQKKEIELANKNKSSKREYENTVHACLVKILFAVQQLHVDLSRDCSQIEAANQASDKFSSTLNEYQKQIADNQISLSTKNNTSIYSFYQILSEMLIELRSLCADGNGDLAQVSVYEHAKRLADEVITLQENILREREELAADFDRAQLETMRHCCRSQPSAALLARYKELREKVAETLEDLPMQMETPKKLTSELGQPEE